MNFKDFKKELKEIEGLKFTSKKEWEIFLPYGTSREVIQEVLYKCRAHLLITWHIVYSDITETKPEPDVRMYWDVCTE